MHYIFCIMETNSHQTEIKVNTQKWVFHLSLLQLIESEITLIYKYNGPPHLWIGGVGSWVGLIQKKVIIKANLAASIFFLLYIICHKANPKAKMHGSPDDAFPLQSQTLMHQRQITICIVPSVLLVGHFPCGISIVVGEGRSQPTSLVCYFNNARR